MDTVPIFLLLLALAPAQAVRCFVDGAIGQDGVVCNTAAAPCASLEWALGNCLNATADLNETSLEVVLSPGVHVNPQSFRVDLRESVVNRIAISGVAPTHHVAEWGDGALSVVTCKGTGAFLNIYGGEVELRDVVVSDCGYNEDTHSAVRVRWPNVTTVQGVTFHNCSAGAGAGLSIIADGTDPQASITVQDCRFSGNHGDNGALFMATSESELDGAVDGTVFHVNNLLFENNVMTMDGALAAQSLRIAASNLRFRNNVCSGFGGSISGSVVHGSWTNVTIESSYSASGGAVFLFGSSATTAWQSTISGLTIVDCVANHGGGVYTWRVPQMTISDSYFADNSASVESGGHGGHLYLEESMVVMEHCVLERGRSSDSAGLIKLNGVLTMTNVTFNSNEAVTQGGAVAAVHVASGDETLPDEMHFVDCVFNNNTAGSGGAVYTSQGVYTTMQGITFLSNHAVAGFGGTLLVQSDAVVTMEDITFVNNTATGAGGAVAMNGESRVVLSGASFHNHQANVGGVFRIEDTAVLELSDATSVGSSAVYGGGFMHILDQATALITSLTVEKSTATSDGGAILVEDYGIVSLNTSQWRGCSSAGNGGVVCAEGFAEVYIHNTVFQANTAHNGGAVYTDSSSAHSFSSTTFSNNSATIGLECYGKTGYGGGIYYNDQPCMDSFADVRFASNNAEVAGGDVFASQAPTEQCSPSSLLPRCEGVCELSSTSTALYGAQHASAMASMEVQDVWVNDEALQQWTDSIQITPGDALSMTIQLFDALGSALAGQHDSARVFLEVINGTDVLSLNGPATATAREGQASFQDLVWSTLMDRTTSLHTVVQLTVSPESILPPGDWSLRVEVMPCAATDQIWIPSEDGGRCVEDVSFSGSQKILLLVLVGITALALLLSTILIVVYRNSRVMFAASFVFMLLVCLGLWLCVLAAFVSVLDQTNTLCTSAVWLVHVGFSMVFGAIWLKQWRLWRIFDNKKLKVRSYPNSLLLKTLAAFLACVCVPLVVWTAVWPRELLSDFQPKCTSEHEDAFFVFFLALHVVVLLSLLYLSVRTRQVPKMYNEVTGVSFAVYNVLVFGAVGVVVSWVADLSTASRQSLFIILVCVLCVTTLMFYVVPKFRRVLGKHDRFSNVLSGTSSPRLNSGSQSPSNGNKMKKFADNIDEGRHNLQGIRNRFERLQEQTQELFAEYKEQEERIAAYEFEKQYMERNRHVNLHKIKSSYDLRSESGVAIPRSQHPHIELEAGGVTPGAPEAL